ncbi:MAG: hypothetical protein EA360_00325 [Balneolaceae bacterium]|nr:MAG: hypothetical protein EA360_00325 [Balneolaceae bacterium]
MKFQDTTLQIIEFGDDPSDRFYCLVDERVSPGGLNIEKMRLTDPRNIDLQFREAGSILMLTGDEAEELFLRGELDRDQLHKSLFTLAEKEGVIRVDTDQSKNR